MAACHVLYSTLTECRSQGLSRNDNGYGRPQTSMIIASFPGVCMPNSELVLSAFAPAGPFLASEGESLGPAAKGESTHLPSPKRGLPEYQGDSDALPRHEDDGSPLNAGLPTQYLWRVSGVFYISIAVTLQRRGQPACGVPQLSTLARLSRW